MTEAILESHKVIVGLCELQEELQAKVAVEKKEYEIPEADTLIDQLAEKYYDRFKAAKQTEGKQARAEAVSALKAEVTAEMIPNPDAEDAICPQRFGKAWHDLEARVVRDLILAGTRPDGRDGKTLRP